MFTRKGQMEIMGLAIVIILISLGLLFFVQFALLKEGGETRVLKKEVSANVLNALMVTTTNCSLLDMTGLLQDCEAFNQVECEGKNSCKIFVDVAEDLLNKTLNKWAYDYYLVAYKYSEDEPIGTEGNQIEIGKRCQGDFDSNLYFITTSKARDKIFILLEVC